MPIPNPPKISPKLNPVKSSFKLSKDVRRVGNISIRFEGIPDGEVGELVGYVDTMVRDLKGDMADDDELMSKWFGTAASTARTYLRVVRDYLTKRCMVLTFVRKLTGALCDKALVEISDYGQVIPTVKLDGQTRDSFRTIGSEVNVPTGLRIFLLPYYFSYSPSAGKMNEKLNCVFHEIMHKVCAMSDQAYGPERCMKKAKDSPAIAAVNPDNYGYLLADYELKWA